MREAPPDSRKKREKAMKFCLSAQISEKCAKTPESEDSGVDVAVNCKV